MPFTGTDQPQARPRRTGLLVAGVGAAAVVAVLLVVVVLGRAGVIHGGPFAEKVPKVAPVTTWPAQAGGLYLIDDAATRNPLPVLSSSKYDWDRSAVYSTTAPNDHSPHVDFAQYIVDAYGSLKDVRDVFIDPQEVVQVGDGTCATQDIGTGVKWRVCGVNRGSMIVAITGKYRDRDDETLVRYASALAAGVS